MNSRLASDGPELPSLHHFFFPPDSQVHVEFIFKLLPVEKETYEYMHTGVVDLAMILIKLQETLLAFKTTES